MTYLKYHSGEWNECVTETVEAAVEKKEESQGQPNRHRQCPTGHTKCT